MADFDAVVVGGGTNGLAAALRLAEAGWSVCLVEANDELGGATRTVECTLPGFRHDLGAGFLPLLPCSPVLAGRDLARHGLALVHAPLAAAHPLRGGGALAVGATVDDTAASLDRHHPGDGAAWRVLDAAYADAVRPLLGALFTRWPVVPVATLVRRLGIGGALDLARAAIGGADGLGEGFSSPQARAFVAAWATHADLAPDAAGSGVYALVLALLAQHGGMPVAQGGTGSVTRALTAALLEAGGVIALARPVSRFVVERGRVVGVEAGGAAVSAGRAVIATLNPDEVIRRTGVEHFPPGAVEQVRRFRRGLGTFKLDWALDGPVPWTAADCRAAGVIHISEDLTAMSRAVWEARHGLLPAVPNLVLGQQSLADPTRAPRGKHTLWGYTHVPAQPRGDAAPPAAAGGHDAGWAAMAERFQDRIEGIIEQHAPGFRDRVLARRAWTPKQLEEADANLADGDISGGSYAIDQQLLFRPGPAWWRWGTPLAGLYLAGAATHPGGGVHGASGDMAARRALADARRSRRLLLAAATGAAGLAVAKARRPRR